MISLIGEINNPFEGSYSDNPLKIGMFLNAIIDGKKFNDVVRVPRYAVRDDKIWVVNQEGILTSKKVTVLRYEQGQALIISGLDNGDEILLTKLSAPVDGMRLNVY
jgi:multidrug efflux pump subunit AcrA (membrane-fusion protein)